MDISIVFSCDNNYVKFLATAMTSILFNAAKDDYFDFYIMDGGIKDEEKLKIDELQRIKTFSLKYIDVENFEKLNLLYIPAQYHFSKAAYARFFIADYLPDIKKVIYLDVDLVVLCSLSNLFEIELGDQYLAACPQCRGFEMENVLRLGTLGRRYFNSGVMLLNLEKWRKENISTQLVEAAQSIKDKIRWVDQDVLNYFFQRYISLDHKWNCEAENYINYPSPGIVHFQGGNKFEFVSSFLLHEYIAKTPYKSFAQNVEPASDNNKPSYFKKSLKNFLITSLNSTSFSQRIALRFSSFVQSHIGLPPVLEVEDESDLKKKFIQKALKLHFPDQKVAHGPFMGMKYPQFEAVCSTIFPKLLGSYEKEIAPVIYECIREQPEAIIDVGCTEGYYAVGFALACPNSKVYAFDGEPQARKLCREMASVNQVENRVRIKEACNSWRDMKVVKDDTKLLIICDIEGFEKKILTKDAFTHFSSAKFLIEVHDCFDIYISSYIMNACKDSHDVNVIRAISDLDKAIEYNYPELQGYDLVSKSVLLAENRPESMKWFYLTPKSKEFI